MSEAADGNCYRAYFEQRAHWGRRYEDVSDGERARVDAICTVLPADARTILDVGCGDGLVTNELLRRGRNVTGLDFSTEALRHVRAPTVQASSDALPLADREVDAIIAADVLEHLPAGTFERTVAEIGRVAARYVVVNSPHAEDLMLAQTHCNRCATTFHAARHVRTVDADAIARWFPDFVVREARLTGEPWPHRSRILLRLAQLLGNLWYRTPSICPTCGYAVEPPRPLQVVRIAHAAAQRLLARARAAFAWAEAQGHAGFDPFDVWAVEPWRRLLPPPTNRATRVARAAAVRLLAHTDGVVRHAWRVPRRALPQTLAQAAHAAVALGDLAAADRLLERLHAARVPGRMAWGLGYSLPGVVPLGDDIPAITTTHHVYRALAARADAPGGERAAAALADVAREVASWDLLPAVTGACHAYAPGATLHVHNANLAAADLLDDAAARGVDGAWDDRVEAAAAYWLADWKRGAGFEYLGPEDRVTTAVDHLHVALVVHCLTELAARHVAIARVLPAVRERYLRAFFSHGWPSSPGDRGWTSGGDAAEAALAILGLDRRDDAVALLSLAADRLSLGETFAYRLHRSSGRVDRRVYLRWVHAPMTLALAKAATSA